MIVTEEEAKTKRCVLGINQGPCIGSTCMAWRWQPLMTDDAWVAAVKKAAEDIKDASSNRMKAAKHVNDHRAEYGLPTKPTRGYCGLAGWVEA